MSSATEADGGGDDDVILELVPDMFLIFSEWTCLIGLGGGLILIADDDNDGGDFRLSSIPPTAGAAVVPLLGGEDPLVIFRDGDLDGLGGGLEGFNFVVEVALSLEESLAADVKGTVGLFLA